MSASVISASIFYDKVSFLDDFDSSDSWMVELELSSVTVLVKLLIRESRWDESSSCN
jgi:hypothetical protein